MGMQRKGKNALFNHFDVAEQWHRTLNEDLNQYAPIASKEWDFYKSAQQGGLKKYPAAQSGDCDVRKEAALSKFMGVISHLSGHPVLPALPDPDYFRVTPRGERTATSRILARARSVCRQILGNTLETDEWFRCCKHGPGTSLGVPFDDSGNSSKFVPPWTTTEDAVPWFEHYLRYDQLLHQLLVVGNPDLADPCKVWNFVEVVKSSRLTTVPKNSTTDRTIAVEPTLNMFLQQGLGKLISDKLCPFGVDIQRQQDKHRELAYTGSITRSLATIDFSSASDTVSTDLLRFLLPPVWFGVVDSIRCRSVEVKGEVVDLPCIATMGNATTFPLETLVFFSIAVAAVADKRPTRSLFPEWEDFTSVSVFGDDCILPTDDAGIFIDACKAVGFLVNEEKSFIDRANPFRESCGADFFGGYNVRPVFPTGPRSNKPSNLRAWLYVLWNTTCKRLISSFGSHTYAYTYVLQYLAKEISTHNTEVFLVSQSDPDDAGLKTYGDWDRLHRLFSVPATHGFLDKNGTLRYKKLVSAPPGPGLFTPEMELWLKLKFPPVNDPMRPVQKTRDFTVKKSDRGYVVGWSSSFDDDLRKAYGVVEAPIQSEESSSTSKVQGH